MPAAYVETDYAWVRLRSERLAVYSSRDKDPSNDLLQEIPLLGLERLCVQEHVQITTEALCALFKAGVPVHYVDWKGDCLGTALATSPAEAAARLEQYRRSLDPAFTLIQSHAIVAAKIQNQLRLVQRLNSNRPRWQPSDWDPLAQMIGKAESAPDLDILRGVEGRAAAVHYQLCAPFLPEDFPIEHRSARPPHNAFNACLSYASVLLYHYVVATVHTRGLDPGLGLLHSTENGRWALALDLMEPFRPALCDALAIRLFTHRILGAGDFEARDGGVYLNNKGRKELIQHHERRMDRMFLSEQAGHRTSLRQAITDQTLSFKAAISNGASFKPFRLN